METKVILITGATSGVGKATAMALAKPQNHLFLVARNARKGEILKKEILAMAPQAQISLLYADLALLRETRELATAFKTQSHTLDVLINCAGLVSSSRVETEEGIEQTLAVNYLSHYLLSHLLVDALKRSPQGRVINVASLIPPMAKVNFADIHSKQQYNGVAAYLQSKVADVMFTYDLAEQLKNSRVTVNAVHPGIVKTNLGLETSRGALQAFVRFCMSVIAITPQESAQRVLFLAESDTLAGVTGKYFKGGRKPVNTNAFSYDPGHREKLRQMTHELAGPVDDTSK